MVVHGRKRGHEMIFDLPTDERKPLFGAVGAKLGLRQVALRRVRRSSLSAHAQLRRSSASASTRAIRSWAICASAFAWQGR
jgi:hypothetical protein